MKSLNCTLEDLKSNSLYYTILYNEQQKHKNKYSFQNKRTEPVVEKQFPFKL